MSVSVQYAGDTGLLYELPDSPVLEVAEKITKTRTYRGLHSLCMTSIIPRGTFGTGDEAGYTLAKCSVAREKGAIGKITFVWEASSGDSGLSLPPDDFGLTPFEANPKLEKHARYQTGGVKALTEKELELVRAAISGLSPESRDTNKTKLSAAGEDLLEKLKRGTENFYLAGFEYRWTLSFWTQPTVDVGGYISTPGGPLGSLIASLGLSCLRMADDLTFSGQYYKLTRSWKCGPAGMWDADLYS